MQNAKLKMKKLGAAIAAILHFTFCISNPAAVCAKVLLTHPAIQKFIGGRLRWLTIRRMRKFVRTRRAVVRRRKAASIAGLHARARAASLSLTAIAVTRSAAETFEKQTLNAE